MFGKKKVQEEVDTRTAAEKIVMIEMKDDDEYAKTVALQFKNDVPTVINFKRLDPESGNRFLPFFIGAITVLDGKVVKINEFTYLFALNTSFMDGSLIKWLDKIPNR